MKKHLLLATVFFLSLISGYSQTTCQVTASASSTTVCVGQQVTVSATALASIPSNQFFDFNQNQLPQGWSTTGGTNYSANICGQSPSGTPYFWASTAGNGVPQIVTADFDICSGGYIEFKMRYAVQGGSSPCEGPDLAHEGVSLQYSLNGGGTWVNIIYYSPGGYTLPANPGTAGSVATGNTPYTVWNTFNVPIPPAAISSSTRFRWVQTNSSGTCCDNWGLDDIAVYAGPCLVADLVWSNGLAGVGNFTFTASADTCFTANLYDDNNNFLCSDDICISVYPNYTDILNVTICEGQGYQFGPNSAVLTYTTAGSYPVMFPSVWGCDSLVTLNLTVTPPLNETISASICDGDSYTFGPNSLTQPGQYTHTFQTAAGCDSIVTLDLSLFPTYNEDIFESICPGSAYTFNGQDFTTEGIHPVMFQTVSGCDSLINIHIDFYDTYSQTKDTTICNGFVYQFAGQSFTSAGTYPLMFQTVNGCDSLITLTIDVTPAPLPFAGNDIVICSDEVGNIGQNPNADVVYQWLTPNGLSDPSVSNPTVSISTNTLLNEQYVLQSDYFGCIATDTVLVTVVPYPVPAILPPAAQCFLNNEFAFNPGNGFLPGATFAWTFENGTPAQSNLQNPAGVSFSQHGVHNVSVTISNGNCATTQTIPVTVHEQPVAIIGANPLSGCVPHTVNFENLSTPVGTSANWIFGNGNGSSNANPSTTYNTAGSYTVTLSVTTPQGCFNEVTIPNLITAHPNPVAGFGASPWMVYADDPIINVYDASVGASTWNYLISSGGVFSTPDFTFSFYDTGYHYIQQIVTTQFGCTDEITQAVQVRPATTLWVPNAFTPGNTDNINPMFFAVGNDVTDFYIRIYDRWGQLVFSSSDIHEGWDGTRKGNLLKQDVYTYRITYKDHRGYEQLKLGHVTLIR